MLVLRFAAYLLGTVIFAAWHDAGSYSKPNPSPPNIGCLGLLPHTLVGIPAGMTLVDLGGPLRSGNLKLCTEIVPIGTPGAIPAYRMPLPPPVEPEKAPGDEG